MLVPLINAHEGNGFEQIFDWWQAGDALALSIIPIVEIYKAIMRAVEKNK